MKMSKSLNKTLNERIAAIQKEQVQLTYMDRALEQLLGKVNESLNELKVEELQLKSGIVEQFTAGHQDDKPTTSAQAALFLNATSTAQDLLSKHEEKAAMHMDENINKQILALESLLVPLKQNNYSNEEEEDEDDEVDDDVVDDVDYYEGLEEFL